MAYQGITARLPVGFQGFSGSRNSSQMQPGHLIAVEGLSLEAGVIQKEGGAEKFNDTALDGIVIAGTHWCPTPGTTRDVVFTADGKLLKDSGAGTFATVLKTGLTSVREPPPVFSGGGGETVAAARKLFMFSAPNQVQVLIGDGITAANINEPAADWSASFPKFGLQHAGRMVAGGNISDPHRIYLSALADHEKFVTGALSFPIYPSEGEGLVGAISFRGVLILFKFPRGIYTLDTRDPNSANWVVGKLSDSVGAINQGSIIQVENDVMYMGEGGNIHLLSATNDLGDVNTSNISQIADLRPFISSEVNLTQLKRVVGIWYPAKRLAMYGLPTLGNADNGLRLTVDFNRPDVGPRFLPTQRDENVAMWMRQETGGSRPANSDGDGFVWLLDREARTKDGAAYPLLLGTANTDLSFVDPLLAGKTKNGQFLELVSEPRGNWNLTVEVYWDDKLTDIKQFSMGSAGAALGAFVLDSDVLTSSAVHSKRERIAGSGRRFRLSIYNSGIGENVSVADFLIGFTAGDERDKSASA